MVATAMRAADPVVQLAAVFGQPAIRALDKPEVKGQAELFIRARPVDSQPFRGQRDSLMPTFAPAPSWVHVPLDGTASLRVSAIDEDLVEDDPIGLFVIGPDVLRTAAQRGRVYAFNVADQTGGAVLFASIFVVRE